MKTSKHEIRMKQDLNSQKLQLIQEILAIDSETVLEEIKQILQGGLGKGFQFSEKEEETFAKRSKEIKSGEVKGVSWDEVQKTVGLK